MKGVDVGKKHGPKTRNPPSNVTITTQSRKSTWAILVGKGRQEFCIRPLD